MTKGIPVPAPAPAFSAASRFGGPLATGIGVDRGDQMLAFASQGNAATPLAVGAHGHGIERLRVVEEGDRGAGLAGARKRLPHLAGEAADVPQLINGFDNGPVERGAGIGGDHRIGPGGIFTRR